MNKKYTNEEKLYRTINTNNHNNGKKKDKRLPFQYRSAITMERFLAIGGRTVDEKFPCIVCSLETNSIDELHNHQKYKHTSEELSLSVICLVHYICLKNESTVSNPKPSLSENDNQPRPSEDKRAMNDLKTTIISSWEKELGRVREISDEMFLNGVQGICKDLKDIERERPAQTIKRSWIPKESEVVVKRRKMEKKAETTSTAHYSSIKQQNEPKRNLQRLESFTEAFRSVRRLPIDQTPRGIPLLQNETASFCCNQDPGQMPVLEPHIYVEQILRTEL